MINIKVYTKNKNNGTVTSSANTSSNSNNNTNMGGGSGSWLEKYFTYDSENDILICNRKLGSNDNIIGFIPKE